MVINLLLLSFKANLQNVLHTYGLVSFCLSVCVLQSWAQVIPSRKSKMSKNDVCIFWHFPSNGVIAKMYCVTHFSKVNDTNRDLHTTANAQSSATIASTVVFGVTPSPNTSLHTWAKCPFKCGECECNCDESDICGNRQKARHTRALHLKVDLPDSVPFICPPLQMITKLFLKIYLHLYGTRRRVGLVNN